MAPISVQGFFKASRAAVADADLRRKLDNANTRQREHAARAIAEFPAYQHERDAARTVKEAAIRRLDQLLLELRRKLQARGSKVFFAADAAEARDYILKVARQAGAKLVVKGKSMTTEEIELNPALEQANI
ncbi:MAG: LUD domain-containing protein, partial [Candidatus Binataceae bacterium]